MSSRNRNTSRSISSLLVTEEQEILKKLENLQSKRSLEVLSTFLPDQILKSAKIINKYENHFVVMLFVEISGITGLCEKYNKVGNGGTNFLTAWLNTYFGIIIEIVHFYGGDVIKFSGDEVMASWKRINERSKIVHQVIMCAMYIREILKDFKTDVNTLFKMKISVCYGDACFFVIGEHTDKELVVTGSVTEDIKFVKTISMSGEVILSAATWRCLPVHRYRVSPLAQGFVKLINCEYMAENEEQLREDQEKRLLINELCKKHMEYKNNLFAKKQFADTMVEADLYEEFVRSIPQRAAIKMAVKHWQPYDLKPFVMRLVQNQLDSRLSVTNLTEGRELTIQYINFLTNPKDNFIIVLDEIYKKIQEIINQFLGVLVNISVLDKDVSMLVVYGTKPCRQGLESKNAVVSSSKIIEAIMEVGNASMVTIGIANGYVYSGVIGHPMRKEFLLIGKVITRAAKFMCTFPGKVVCDYKTYKHSKLSTQYFTLLPSSEIKLEDGAVFEYNGLFYSSPIGDGIKVIGRDEESDLIFTIVNHPDMVNYYGICFHGERRIGKSRLLQHNFCDLSKGGYTIVSVELSSCSRRPYFCISKLYKQLYNLKSTIDSDEFVFVQNLPSDLWDFSEILQNTLHYKDSYIPVQRKFRVLSLFREITRNCELGFAVIFIDNIQYIDRHSFDILETIVGECFIRLICAGQFDEEFWDIRFRISLNNHIKLLELTPIVETDFPKLLCSLLEVSGISWKLVDEIANKCDFHAGLVESVLMRLVNEGTLKTHSVEDKENLASQYFILPEDSNNNNILVATVENDFSYTGQVNVINLSTDFINKLSEFKLNLIKVASALGKIFSRFLLKLVFKYTYELEFANAIKYFYEEGIFECGSKYLTPEGLTFEAPCCYCQLNEDDLREDVNASALPNYAFCQVLYFKNSDVKNIAYSQLTDEEKINLHLKATEVLENQNHSCSNCLQNNSAPIVVISKFREVSFLCNKELNYKCDYFAGEIKETSEQCGENTWDMQNFISGKRKVWDGSICSCLDILIQTYTSLVYHSTEAHHLEKKIYFTMQRGFIMMLMNEFEEAIRILNEANNLCNGEILLDKNFCEIHVAKINLLIAQAYLSLSDGARAKHHLLVCLKEYEITVVPSATGYKIFQSSKIDYQDEKLYLKSSMIQNDFGSCLNLVSSVFAFEGDWDMAKVASNQCVAFLNNHLATISVLCDIYSNAISIYSFTGDDRMCEKLEKSVSQHILKKFSTNVIYDLFSISKLIFAIFHARFVSSHLETAIRLGYRAVDMNNSIHAYRIQIDVASILAIALVYVKRIDDSVEVARVIYNIGRYFDEFALSAYYAYCMDLILETSFF
ncbi:testicular soluble adenylyl cyclase [Holotrichia oblita]|uniref:Testicular soluble adenylyl cyclase n=1 Tax=Holotrichia oblita TaxID=644536 RepID=A0ACB9TL88_HOLOL|nr:testicular soluble adenylyl cyclase [Holotrichia oblita]